MSNDYDFFGIVELVPDPSNQRHGRIRILCALVAGKGECQIDSTFCHSSQSPAEREVFWFNAPPPPSVIRRRMLVRCQAVESKYYARSADKPWYNLKKNGNAWIVRRWGAFIVDENERVTPDRFAPNSPVYLRRQSGFIEGPWEVKESESLPASPALPLASEP